MWKITDPAKSLERIYERMHETEQAIAAFEQTGLFPHCAKLERRRLAGLKAARTRIVRQYLGG